MDKNINPGLQASAEGGLAEAKRLVEAYDAALADYAGNPCSAEWADAQGEAAKACIALVRNAALRGGDGIPEQQMASDPLNEHQIELARLLRVPKEAAAILLANGFNACRQRVIEAAQPASGDGREGRGNG